MSYFINDLSHKRNLWIWIVNLIDGLVLGGIVLYRMFALGQVMTLYASIPIGLMGVLVFFLEMRMEKFKHVKNHLKMVILLKSHLQELQ